MEDKFIFIDNDLPRNSFRTFDNMRAEGFLCDVTFKIGDRKVSAHRSILAASSPYFRSMFLSMKNEPLDEITVPEVEPDALEALIQFSYKSHMEITSDNIRPVLVGSHFLKMDHVFDACCHFLSRTMLPHNALDTRAFAVEHGFQKLKQIADDYVQRYFVQVSHSEGFLDLPFSEVKELVASKELHIASEDLVFQAIMAWVKRSVATREDKLHELLSTVRWSLLSADYLSSVASEELIQKSDLCKNLLKEAELSHLLSESKLVCGSSSSVTKPNHFNAAVFNRDQTEESLFSVCVNIERHSLTVMYLVPKYGTWRTAVEDGSVYAADAAVVAIGKKLYIIGGCDIMGNALAIVQVFDSDTGAWGSVASMNEKRYNAAAVVFFNKIYVFGGITGYAEDTISCSAECFNPEINRWTYIPEMSEHRLGACAVCLDEFIYILGGCGGGSDLTAPSDLKSVERYCPRTREWTNMSEMTGPLCLRGAATLHGKIYVHGEKYIEVYDASFNTWHRISYVRHHKSGFTLVALRGKLMAVGGKLHPADETPSAFDVYDPAFDEWSEEEPLPICTCFLGSATVLCSN